MAIRIIAFPIWVLLTSWMDLGQEYDDAETFGWSRISFNYQNHVQDSLRVRSEQALEFHRNFHERRQRSQNFATVPAVTSEMGQCPICTCELDLKSESTKVL